MSEERGGPAMLFLGAGPLAALGPLKLQAGPSAGEVELAPGAGPGGGRGGALCQGGAGRWTRGGAGRLDEAERRSGAWRAGKGAWPGPRLSPRSSGEGLSCRAGDKAKASY